MPTGKPTNQQTKAATIQRGRVLDVDMATYTLVVASEFTKKVLASVPFATPYQHFVNGEGIYFMPEVGSLCWLCEPSDGGMPFVLSWAAGQDEGDYRGRKRDLNPGDIFLGTRDENFLVLRRGGIVQIGGGPLSQRMFLPVDNTIKDLCENYSLNTLGGDLEWHVKRSETDTDGKRPTTLRLAARQFANDKNPLAVLEIGSQEGDDATILKLQIKASGEDGAATQISLKLTKEGNVQWEVQKDVSWVVKGNQHHDVSGDMTADVGGNWAAAVKGQMELLSDLPAVFGSTTATTNIESPVQIVLEAPITNAGGAAAQIPVALGPPLLIWLAAHTHLIIVPVPGTPTGPAAASLPGPPPPSIISTSLFAK